MLTYAYGQANRLKAVSGGQSAANSYAYNGLGDRLSQTVGGAVTRYALDPGAGLTQVLSEGTNAFLYGNGRLAQYQTAMQYFGADALGSVRLLYDASGQVIANARYDPYGNVVSASGAASSYGYTGAETDSTGLTYLRARYYSAAQGRFVTRDTWEGDEIQPASLNGWSYVANNPATLTDPSGMCWGGAGIDDLLNGLETPLGEGGWDQIQLGWNKASAECQQNLKTAEQFLRKGDYGRAVAAGSGLTSATQHTYQWVSDFNLDWAILQDRSCDSGIRAAAGQRMQGRFGQLTRPAKYVMLVDAAMGTAERVADVGAALSADTVDAGRANRAVQTEGAGGLSSRGAIRIFDAMNPGPLADDIAKTFSGGRYIERVLQTDTIMWRVYGDKALPTGSFLSPSPQVGGIQSTIDNGLVQSWRNTAEHVVQVKIPADTTIYEGISSYQGSIYLGGTPQVYIPRVDPSWIIKQVR